jgi:predicted PurR-regulated permease PerM
MSTGADGSGDLREESTDGGAATAAAIRQMRTLVMISVAIIAMWWMAEFFQPVALAVLLGFVLTPLVKWLESHLRLPRAAAVLVTIAIVSVGIGGVGYVVVRQMISLAAQLPSYQGTIREKLSGLRPNPDSTVSKLTRVAQDVEHSLAPVEEKVASQKPVEVHIQNDSSPIGQFSTILGPFHEIAGLGGIVALLLVFLLIERDEIGDRIVQLAGRGKLSMTTRTMSQIGRRVSKYLATFSLANLCFGLVVATMLWLLGVPYATLWGTLAGLLRFIPYVGPMVAFTLPTIFSLAYFKGWTWPLLIVGCYVVLELIINSIEPMLYGKTTGVSALSLLVAALFWTWLWGPLGLLLSTPLTVCLLVVGSQVADLSFLGTLLRDDLEIEDDLRLYQKLLHRDQEGAIAFLDELAASRPLDRVFDGVVLPALSRATLDHEQGGLERRDLVYTWGVLRLWLDELEVPGAEDVAAATASDAPPRHLVGVACRGISDALALRMLAKLLGPNGPALQAIEAFGSPLVLADQVAEMEPSLIILSHVPPVGVVEARYLAKRLHTTLPEIPLLVGHWDQAADPMTTDWMKTMVNFRTVTTLSAARAAILEHLAPQEPTAALKPGLAGA